MLFLADENFPVASIKILRKAGYEIASVIEDSPGAKDSKILARANREMRIILTFDRDYGELIYRLKLPCQYGVVYFRFAPLTPEEPAEYLLNLLNIKDLSLKKFTVVERSQIRQRPLP
jgi:predicted nuclease of predicted toxin-antitoxin system